MVVHKTSHGKRPLTDTSITEPTRERAWRLGPGRAGLVSVIVPVYNRENLVVDTLNSVRTQTYRPIELIIVDDGSTDATAELVDRWVACLPADDLFVVRVLRQENAGAAVARNHGTAESQGEFIQFLDSDDVLDSNKIARQVRALTDNPSSDFAYGPVAKLDDPDDVVYCQTAMSQRRMIMKNLVVPTIQTMSALVRRSMAERVGCWNPTLLPCEDWEYYSRAAVLGSRGIYVEESRSYYRTHEGERLSKHSALDCAARGRFGQIDSMLAHAPDSVKSDPAFAKTASWQLMIATARFVFMGWQGDEAARYRKARDIGGNGTARLVAVVLVRAKRTLGRRNTARLFLVLPWIFYRLAGLKARFWRSGVS